MTEIKRVLFEETPVKKPGRRQNQVLQVYKDYGPEAAWVHGRKLGLKDITLRVWFSNWQRSTVNAKR